MKGQIIRLSCRVLLIFLAFSSAGQNSLAARSATKPSSSRSGLAANGTILLNHDTFFPLGFYISAVPSDKVIRDLAPIQAAGFNTVDVPVSDSVLNEIDRLGLYLQASVPTGRDPEAQQVEAFVRKYKNTRSLLAWSFGDDAGDHASAKNLEETNRLIKSLDPDHLTYISVSGWSKKLEEFTNSADMIGAQAYPITFPFRDGRIFPQAPNAVGEVYPILALATAEATKHGYTSIANLQTFSWGSYASDYGQEPDQCGGTYCRWPTGQEVYNMTYQAMLAGVQGILYYAYEDDVNRVAEHPDVWKMLLSIPPEVKTLTPILTNGTRHVLTTGDPELLAGTWQYQGKLYVLVINTSDRYRPKEVALALEIPAQATGAAEFSNRPATLHVEGRFLKGPIGPLGVQLYAVDLGLK